MKNFFNNQENQQLTINAIIFLFAIILLSLSIIFYLVGLFGNPLLENFFADVSSLLFIGFIVSGVLYLVKIIASPFFIRYIRNKTK